ncbi:MAG: DNA gyrase subunit A [Bacilli bacterium]|nr:DNA gyrase subunit A [Bacilli bacterium]MDD4406600.1 DNA gyrase subunit A [Bacilli bacterium]
MENNINLDKFNEINIDSEIKNSFLDYSMSVIVSRAIPDVRDGLKPVHRRLLYTFHAEGITHDKSHKKSATSCGKVMQYHPHGDAAIYDTMARMAQDFTYRYPLIDGKGAFGAPDGSSPAAARYTEARLAKISSEMLRDINKNAVDFIPSYDDESVEPVVLPSRFPNILVNGNMGIAVGMATNIPPHNLGETIDATIAYINNPEITILELMEKIKGPDFPTGGTILGNSGIKKAFETGKGSIKVRGKVDIEEIKGKVKLIITEIPYQVNYTNIIRKIAELVRDKQIDGIANLTDESALEGIRIVIDVKKDYNPSVLLNNLYKYTQLQTSFGINFLMLVDRRPKTLSLKEILENYTNFQKSVIIRRTQFDLEKSERAAHIQEGLKIALDFIDEVIKLIKGSKKDVEAKKGLMERFGLSEIQAEAIMEMKLRRLTGLEKEKIEEELKFLLEKIEELKSILASKQKISNIIVDELTEIKDKYSDERRTAIDMTSLEYIEDESLIPEENITITLTEKGYIKRIVSETYKTQNKGGVGVKGMSTNEEDFVEKMINLSTHDYVMFFTNKGKVYRLKGYEIPKYSRQSKGLPIINLLPLDKEEVINSIIPLSTENEYKYFVFATKNGLVKRTKIDEFNNIRVTGKICIKLKSKDELIGVKKTDGNYNILLASENGKMVVFLEEQIRIMGRTASGVKGINLDNSNCIGLEVAKDDSNILIITENGYGKKTLVSEYRKTKRGSKGVKALNITEKNGKIKSFKRIENSDNDIMIITDEGTIIRLPLDQISQLSRVTQGSKLIHLKNNQKVSTFTLVEKNTEETEEV